VRQCLTDSLEGAGTVLDAVDNQSVSISGNTMVLKIRQYIELRGNNPLDAMVAETQYKAYLVANLALNDGSQASADHYRLDLATVYGARTFYYDNETAIHEAIQDARGLGEQLQLGARSEQASLKDLRAHKKAP